MVFLAAEYGKKIIRTTEMRLVNQLKNFDLPHTKPPVF